MEALHPFGRSNKQLLECRSKNVPDFFERLCSLVKTLPGVMRFNLISTFVWNILASLQFFIL